MAIAARRKRFTVDDYYAMGRAGVFGDGDRVELIEGEIIQMSPIGSRHQAIVDRLTHLFVSRMGDQAIVRVQGPLRLAPITEPQPDLQLLAPQDDFYAAAHPSQEEALLVIEVADTSLQFDRDEKALVYARRGVHELWIIDLRHETVLVMRDPSAAGFRQSQSVARGESVSPEAFPQVTVAVEDLLGTPSES